MKKILVIQTASLGDVILATSMLETIHAIDPQASIDLLVRDGFQALFEPHPFIHQVIVWDKKNRKYKNLLRLIRAARKERYDAVFNIQRFASMALFTVFSKAKHTSGFCSHFLSRFFSATVKHKLDGRHETERNADLLESVFGKTMPSRPRLYPDPDFLPAEYAISGNYVLLSPGSLWFTKQMAKEKWVELCRLIPSDYTVVFTGNKAEISLCQSIIDESGRFEAKNLAGQLDLRALIRVASGASFIYANDSAMTHIASALNKPVATFFCSTVPSFGFSPLSDQHFIFEPDEILECRPCGIHGHKECPAKHFKCGKYFSISKIIELTLHPC